MKKFLIDYFFKFPGGRSYENALTKLEKSYICTFVLT